MPDNTAANIVKAVTAKTDPVKPEVVLKNQENGGLKLKTQCGKRKIYCRW